MTHNWFLYVDESGGFCGSKKTPNVVVAGLLVPEAAASRRWNLERDIRRLAPYLPWPHHAAHEFYPVYFALALKVAVERAETPIKRLDLTDDRRAKLTSGDPGALSALDSIRAGRVPSEDDAWRLLHSARHRDPSEARKGPVRALEMALERQQFTFGATCNWIQGLVFGLRGGDQDTAERLDRWWLAHFEPLIQRRPDERVGSRANLARSGFCRLLKKVQHKYRNPAMHHRMSAEVNRDSYREWCQVMYRAPSLRWWLEVGVDSGLGTARDDQIAVGRLGIISALAACRRCDGTRAQVKG